ncbi:MAG: hypothetical protein EOP06_05140 [Proteobacteria bacterium]|nr:MAG: hypothetical protein EOP06_05140 [Pseudomonadota bacterium]
MKTLILSLMVGIAFNPFVAEAKNTNQVVQQIIDESISSYPGNCPCPYNVARNGSRCGKRSAHSRAGGYAPKCFPADVTKQEVAEFKNSHSDPH